MARYVFWIFFNPDIFYGRLNVTTNIDLIYKYNYSIHKIWSEKPRIRITNKKDLILFNKIDTVLIRYLFQIQELALNKHVFRNKNYTIDDFSKQCGIPKYYLIFIFKYYFEISFSDYKKIVRILDAVILIDEDFLNTNTLNFLSDFVGFSSYNPFLISFKELTGVSPNSFKKNKEIINKNYITVAQNNNLINH